MIYETKFVLSLILTLVIEVPVVLILIKLFALKIKKSKAIFVAILATALTIPYLWFVLPKYIDYPFCVIFGEIGVFLVEALIYWKLLPASFKKALLISFIANLFSLIIGLIVHI